MSLSEARDLMLRRRNALGAKVAALRSRDETAPFRSARVTVLRRDLIEGVVVTDEPTPLQVAIYINEVRATTTPSVPSVERKRGGHVQRFRFTLLDLWRFARRTDRITVRVEGHPVQLARRGLVYHPRRDGAESLRTLRQRLRDGEVFGQSGRLQRSRTEDAHWQGHVFRLYQAVADLLREQFDYRPFLYNGTLLGVVRENGFISHDLDFDAAYLSRHTTGAAAAKELFAIADALIAAGFVVIPKYSCIAIRDDDSGPAQIDLFHLYLTEHDSVPTGRVAFPFGTVSTDPITPEQFGEIVERDFAGRRVAVPANAEAVVAHIYGPHWATPNPGFSWVADRGTRDVGLLDLNRQDILYWRSFYAHERRFAAERQEPSTFVRAVLERPDRPHVVMDLGCGDGRDSVPLAEAGHRVIGVDRCEAALEQARARAVNAENPDFRSCDLSTGDARGRLITEARGDQPDTPILFYARFLLHGLPEASQRTLLRTLTEHGRPGDWFVAEVRTDRDLSRRKAFFRTTRRSQPAAELVAELTDTYALTVVDSQEGTGLAPLGPEDPDVVRVFAIRAGSITVSG